MGPSRRVARGVGLTPAPSARSRRTQPPATKWRRRRPQHLPPPSTQPAQNGGGGAQGAGAEPGASPPTPAIGRGSPDAGTAPSAIGGVGGARPWAGGSGRGVVVGSIPGCSRYGARAPEPRVVEGRRRPHGSCGATGAGLVPTPRARAGSPAQPRQTMALAALSGTGPGAARGLLAGVPLGAEIRTGSSSPTGRGPSGGTGERRVLACGCPPRTLMSPCCTP